MSDPANSQPDHPKVDADRTAPKNAFDTPDGYSGQDYNREREDEEGRKRPSGYVAADPGKACMPIEIADNPGIPAQAGQLASFDPKTGEVHGSGSGAGGGNAGEDYDVGTAGGAPEAPQSGGSTDRNPGAR